MAASCLFVVSGYLAVIVLVLEPRGVEPARLASSLSALIGALVGFLLLTGFANGLRAMAVGAALIGVVLPPVYRRLLRSFEKRRDRRRG
jgi:hypothetical protein